MSAPLHPASVDSAIPGKPLVLRWAAVDGAVAYIVQMTDETGAAVLERQVTPNNLEFSVPPGKYRVRIGVINKFGKFWYWSDWEDISVIRRTPFQTVWHKIGVRLGAGPVYGYVLSPWNTYLENSFSGASFNLGVYSDYRFLRYLGIEIETAGVHYRGSEDLALTSVTAGGNLMFRTAFAYPLNGIFRAGGGIAFTRLSYRDAFSAEDIVLWDSCPYYRAGGALEFRFYGDYFVEGGCNYTVTAMRGKDLRGLDFFMRIGARIGRGMEPAEKKMLAQKEISHEAPVMVRICLGYRTVLTLPEWNTYFKNSYTGGTFALALMGRHGFMRRLGLEYEAGAAWYNAKSGSNTLSQYGNGVNLLFHTGLAFPLNLVARMGGGIAVTSLKYSQPFIGESGTLWTEDRYYKASLAAEYRLNQWFFLEAGGEYQWMEYTAEPFRGIAFFVRVGVRL